MTPRFHAFRVLAGALAAGWIGLAGGQAFPTATVVEFYHPGLNHYFLTASPSEAEGIDRGAAGAGWIRTGRGFQAFTQTAVCTGCAPVARFYGTPGVGPNSHFYTASVAEAEFVRRFDPGWMLESLAAFTVQLPDSAGSCPAAAPVPVIRFYNNRWMSNDSNHRYVTRPEDRAEMAGRGWIEEGVAFCVASTEEIALKRWPIDVPLPGNVEPSAVCIDQIRRTGACVAINNLPIPREPTPLGESATVPPAIHQLTGLESRVFAPRDMPAGEVARDVFVQETGGTYGIHVDTRSKGPSAYSSINPLYQLPSTRTPDTNWFFPWRANYPFPTQLSITWNVEVRRIETRTAESHAYGHPTLEFIDIRSRRHLYFTVLTYSTTSGGDYLAPDVTGIVIVGTTPRAGSAFGRSTGTGWVQVPRSYSAGSGPGLRSEVDFRMDLAEFRRVLAAALTVDPQLSPDPGDYVLDNYHFNNEVVNDGEIGLKMRVDLRLLRR
jgi:hypothetical protein